METIVAALLGAAGLVGAAWVTARPAIHVKRTVGNLNGDGTIMQQLSEIRTWIRGHESVHVEGCPKKNQGV